MHRMEGEKKVNTVINLKMSLKKRKNNFIVKFY